MFECEVADVGAYAFFEDIDIEEVAGAEVALCAADEGLEEGSLV
jgi:hypothetical protein